MTIDIDKLRAAHAATTPGTYWAEKPMPQHPDEEGPPDYNPSVVITAKYGPIARLSVSPCFSPDFIALAHNEFPAMLDEIERLRALLSRTIEVFNDTCNCGECGPCKLREEIEGELK